MTWLRYDLDPALEPLTRTELVGAVFFWALIAVPCVAIFQFLWRRRAGIANAVVALSAGVRNRGVAIASSTAELWHRMRQSKGIGEDESQH